MSTFEGHGVGRELGGDGMADDPRLSAYALGELEGEDANEVARLVAADPAARAFVAETRRVAEALEAALAGEAGAADAMLTVAQRGAVEAEASERERTTRRAAWSTRRRWYGALAVAAGLAVVTRLGLGSLAPTEHAAPGDETFLASADEAKAKLDTGSWRPKAQAPHTGEMVIQRDFDVETAQAAAPGSPVVLLAEEVAELELLARGAVRLEEAAPGTVALGSVAPNASGQLQAMTRRLGAVADDRDKVGEAGEAEAEVDAVALDREAYDRIHENPFVPTALDRLSTFSIDVDTASYSNVRRLLRSGATVPPDAVRIEECVNYFTYGYAPPAPGAEHPFAVHTAVTAAPWNPRHRLVRVGLRAVDLDLRERPAANLVFLVDVSGSMDDPAKLPLVKRALALLVEQLGEGDRVAIVVYANAEGLALPSTSGEAREAILQALERLDAGGSTNGGAGIQLAYAVAREHFVTGGINRVVLCTDGDFNVGVTSDGDLERLIEGEAKSGVFLSVLGFGAGNWQDAKMEKLSNRGNGNFAYIDSLLEARKVLVEQLGGTLATVAKDVKVQVEFNPSAVQAARLIGYENRVLRHQEFLDDKKDAGEIGAGHTVTALYEVVPVGVPFEGPAMPEPRFGAPAIPGGAGSDELLAVNLRYKRPDADTSVGFVVPVKDSGASFDAADEDTRFAAAVAAFGMVLRGSEHVGATTLRDVRTWAQEALGEDRGGYREGFLQLLQVALRDK